MQVGFPASQGVYYCLRGWDPENWNGDMQEALDDYRDTKPLNSDESSLPVEEASPPTMDGGLSSPNRGDFSTLV